MNEKIIKFELIVRNLFKGCMHFFDKKMYLFILNGCTQGFTTSNKI